MNKEIKKIIFSSLLLILVFVLPVHAQVNEMENLMINLVAPTPIIRADLIALIFKIIQYLLSFLGVVAIVILIYGGYLWMTARGDEEKVRKAKKVLINGLIGLIIILLSYAIVSFVGGRVKEIAQPGTVCTPGQCCGNCYRCNSDGTACSIWDNLCGTNCVPPGQAFVVSWTYPEDGDENISLCALIQAGFNAELDENYINSETI
ncbi:MAG: Mbov_0395 family pilin-like conjugal transfer protein, partial [Patescibacteria group bacterium]